MFVEVQISTNSISVSQIKSSVVQLNRHLEKGEVKWQEGNIYQHPITWMVNALITGSATTGESSRPCGQ